jgi:predicted methyltransferase MtxX (methanogen marker protein 4)
LGFPTTTQPTNFRTFSLTEQYWGATLVDSQEEELDKCACDTTNSDFPHHTQEIKLTNDELKSHLDAAVKGVMPSGDVIAQLRDSDYWVCFRRAAEVHNWDLGQLSQSCVPAHLKEQM